MAGSSRFTATSPALSSTYQPIQKSRLAAAAVAAILCAAATPVQLICPACIACYRPQIRIRGINDVAPKTKKILQLLRLRQINTGVFLRVRFLR